MSQGLMSFMVVVLLAIQVLSVTSAYAAPATIRANTSKSAAVSSGAENLGILLGDRKGGTRLEDFGILLGDRKGGDSVKAFVILLGDRKGESGVERFGILLGDRGVSGQK